MAASEYGGTEDQFMFHVPQQSSREKLRYAQEVDHNHPLHHHHHPSSYPPPQFYLTGVVQPPPPSSSSHHHNQNSNYHDNYSFFCTPQPSPPLMSLFSHQISTTHHQQPPFSLSLSSSHTSLPPRMQLTDRPTHLGPTPLGPFTGYSEILSRSRFLEPARHLLEEVCSVGGVVSWSEEGEAAAAAARVAAAGVVEEEGQQQQQWRKTKLLLSMLDEVCRGYKLYYQQVQAVITSFESVPGLSSAAPYVSLALKVMSKHFWCLKNAISDQLQHMNKAVGKKRFGEEENNSTTGFGILTSSVSPHRQPNNYGTIRHPNVWRPQRAPPLPERAVAVLRAWLFEHFLYPYPTYTDKQMLAKQTGLTRNQVQRNLQLRIEAQGKYLLSVLEKAQETLGKQNLGSTGLETAKVQLSELVSKVSNECFSNAFPGLEEMSSQTLQTHPAQLADGSMDICLTACEVSQKDQEIQHNNATMGLRTYPRNTPLYPQKMGEDISLDQSQLAWCENLNDHMTYFSSIAKEPVRAGFQEQRNSTVLSMSITSQREKECRRREEDHYFEEPSSKRTAIKQEQGKQSNGFGLSCVMTQLDLNSYDDER